MRAVQQASLMQQSLHWRCARATLVVSAVRKHRPQPPSAPAPRGLLCFPGQGVQIPQKLLSPWEMMAMMRFIEDSARTSDSVGISSRRLVKNT